MIKLISAATLSAALCVPALAQTHLSNPPAGADMVSEAAIVGVLQTVDQNETETAQAAMARSKNEDVLAFARQMIVDHGEASRKLNEVGIQPSNSEVNRKFKEKGKMISRKLNRLEGPAFDRAYMNAQVEDHAAVLDKLDRKFIPSAKSGQLASHLQERRPVIESHLEHARRIKASLGAR